MGSDFCTYAIFIELFFLRERNHAMCGIKYTTICSLGNSMYIQDYVLPFIWPSDYLNVLDALQVNWINGIVLYYPHDKYIYFARSACSKVWQLHKLLNDPICLSSYLGARNEKKKLLGCQQCEPQGIKQELMPPLWTLHWKYPSILRIYFLFDQWIIHQVFSIFYPMKPKGFSHRFWKCIQFSARTCTFFFRGSHIILISSSTWIVIIIFSRVSK